jgi:hypothetical protein
MDENEPTPQTTIIALLRAFITIIFVGAFVLVFVGGSAIAGFLLVFVAMVDDPHCGENGAAIACSLCSALTAAGIAGYVATRVVRANFS